MDPLALPAAGSLPFDLWIGWAVIVVVFTVLSMARGRHQVRHPRGLGATTGRMVGPAPPVEFPLERGAGSGRLRGAFGLMNATVPLCLLRIGTDEIEIRMRPAFLVRRMFGVRPLVAARAPGVAVYPARGRWGSTYLGVAVDRHPVGYFFARDVPSLLETCRLAGYEVSWHERRV